MPPRVNWADLRGKLWTRCEGRCEVSGRPLDPETFDAHHRRNKGMGGTSRPDRDWLTNLLALDPQVHNGGPASVHGRRTWAEGRGLLVPKNVDVAGTWPYQRYDEAWLLLDDEGGYRVVS
jgi:hypothetical protein